MTRSRSLPGEGFSKALEETRLKRFWTRGINPRHGVLLLTVAVAVALIALLAYDLRREYVAGIEATSLKTQNLTRMLEEHARQSLGRVELIVEQAADEVKSASSRARVDWAALRERLAAHIPPDGLVTLFLILDRNGTVVLSTLAESPASRPPVADRDYFSAHRSRAGLGTLFGAPIRGRVTGRRTLPVSARLDSPAGEFRGVLVAFMAPDPFESFYDSIDTGANGFITLFQREGWIVARSPFDERISSRNWADSPMFRQHLRSSQVDTVRQIVAADGVERIYSYRAMSDYPFIVSTGVSLTDSLAAWRARLWRDAIVLLGALGLLYTAAVALARQLQKREAADAALRESEARLKLATGAAKASMWERDLRNKRLYLSPEYQRQIGFLPEDFHGSYEDWESRLHPEDRERALAVVKDCSEGRTTGYESEYRLLHGDGSYRWFLSRATLERDGAGRPQRLIGAVIDITERKRSEELHAIEHAVTRALTEADSIGAALTAVMRKLCETLGWECGRYFRWDEGAGVFRFAESWYLPSPELDRFVADSKSRTFTPGVGIVGRAGAGEPQWVADITQDPRVVNKAMALDHNMRGAFMFPAMSDGAAVGVLAFTSRDIREPDERLQQAVRVIGAQIGQFIKRKHAESGVRASEERFRSLTSLSSDMYWEQDDQFRFTSMTGTGSQRVNVKTFPQIGKKRWDLSYLNMTREKWVEHIGLLEAHRPFRDMELCRLDESGAKVWISVSGEPVFDASGAFAGYRGVGKDITERKNAEDAHQRLEAQLRQAQKMEAIGTLAGGIAHDFNNIVATILGNAELARQDASSGDSVRESLDEIHKAAVRAKGVVQQILAFSREAKPESRRIDLRQVLAEDEKLLRAAIPSGVEFRVTTKAKAPEVLADPTQIHQILLNLCTNSWQAMGGGVGSIEMTLEGVIVDEATARMNADLAPGAYARLTVRDTGMGMDKETLERIFDPFFTTKEVGQGTGLGLAVVHGIMRTLGGAIQVESRPGRGTTFRLYFRGAKERPSARVETEGTQPRRGQGERLLYLDDEEALTFLMRRALELDGYKVSAFTKVDEALAELRARPDAFDLVVTDLNMPGRSGLEVAREIFALRPDLPVVLASGYLTEEVISQARAAGVRDVIYKPNAIDEFARTVGRVLAGAAAR